MKNNQRKEYRFSESQDPNFTSIQSQAGPQINRKCKPDMPGTTELYPMGGYLIPSGETRIARANIDTIDGQPGTQPYDIRVVSPDYQPMSRSQNGSTRVTRMSPSYASFDLNDNNINRSKFDQSLMDSEQRISTGVLLNTNTGQMYETFEDDMPPPNLSKERDFFPEQLNQTNPFLIYSNGGIDPNRDPKNKQEVFAYQPDESDGPNVWGDQLFSQRRRSELEMRAQRDLWQNRNGDYSIESVDDRRPVGYVGFQPANRYFPYMPATQRTFMDSKTYTGHANNEQFTDPHWNELVGPNHHLRPEDEILTIDYAGAANAADNGSYVQAVLDPQVRLTETNRSKNTANTVYNNMQVPGAVFSGNGSYTVIDKNVRSSLKPVTVEKMFGSANCAADENGSYVVVDKNVRDTLKGLMSTMFPTANANGTETTNNENGSITYVLADKNNLRQTLKPIILEKSFGTANCSSENDGAYVVIDKEVRKTLKPEIVEKTFNQFLPVYFDTNVGSYVIVNPKDAVRDTLKTALMETNFVLAPVSFDQESGSYIVMDSNKPRDTLKAAINEKSFAVFGFDSKTDGSYVVLDSAKELRNTLKVETMEKAFGSSNVSVDMQAPIVVLDKELKGTLKTQLEQMFATANVASEQVNGYIISDDNVARDTLKTQLEHMFATANIASEQENGYIVSDDNVARDTLKTQLETMFGTANCSNETTGQYVVIDKEVRHSLKPLLEKMFGTLNAADAESGSQLPFQGPYRSTKRRFYENESQRPALDAAGLFADQITISTSSHTKATPNRGSKNEINYVYGPNKIVEDAKDTSSRYIGHTERVVNREACTRYTAPIKIVEQDERVVPMLETRKFNKESSSDLYYGSPGTIETVQDNYFTSTDANASIDCQSGYYQNQQHNDSYKNSLFYTTDGSNDYPETMNYITNITMPVQQMENS